MDNSEAAVSCGQLISDTLSLQLATLGVHSQEGQLMGANPLGANLQAANRQGVPSAATQSEPREGLSGVTPHIGYTPYIATPEHTQPRTEGGAEGGHPGSRSLDSDLTRCFYIFVSELALHTRDLLQTPRASIMIIDDEAGSQQIFARRRVYYECSVECLDSTADASITLLDIYRERHGKMVDLLRSLPDFRLMRLTPVAGQFVMGFGQAYSLSGSDFMTFNESRRA